MLEHCDARKVSRTPSREVSPAVQKLLYRIRQRGWDGKGAQFTNFRYIDDSLDKHIETEENSESAKETIQDVHLSQPQVQHQAQQHEQHVATPDAVRVNEYERRSANLIRSLGYTVDNSRSVAQQFQENPYFSFDTKGSVTVRGGYALDRTRTQKQGFFQRLGAWFMGKSK